jgi:hypothetical protein
MAEETVREGEEIQLGISKIIGVIFKTHKAMALDLANFLITNSFPLIFGGN